MQIHMADVGCAPAIQSMGQCSSYNSCLIEESTARKWRLRTVWRHIMGLPPMPLALAMSTRVVATAIAMSLAFLRRAVRVAPNSHHDHTSMANRSWQIFRDTHGGRIAFIFRHSPNFPVRMVYAGNKGSLQVSKFSCFQKKKTH